MEVVCGCCRWCREPVRRAEGRYAAADGAVVLMFKTGADGRVQIAECVIDK